MITATWSASFLFDGMSGDVGASFDRNDQAPHRTEIGKERPAASRRKLCENVTWLARRARITNPRMDGEPPAVLVHIAPRTGSSHDIDGRVKAALDAFSTGHADMRRDDARKASLLIFERLALVRGRGDMHFIIGSIMSATK